MWLRGHVGVGTAGLRLGCMVLGRIGVSRLRVPKFRILRGRQPNCYKLYRQCRLMIYPCPFMLATYTGQKEVSEQTEFVRIICSAD